MLPILLRTLFVVGALACAVALGGCSSLSPQQQYIKQADAICQLGSQARRDIPEPVLRGSSSQQLRALGPWLDQIVGEYDAEYERIQGLAPRPAKNLKVLDEFINALRKDVARLEQFDSLVHGGSVSHIRLAAAKVDESVSESGVDDYAKAYGLTACAGTGGV
ncbi:MAG TPA: hypothetical protein VHX88_13775 [Solirubrobacteraceae bacterium]|jgi:hypothetical protein|nr:hypothetical protein [Solirubrobacteraceae bacterium]